MRFLDRLFFGGGFNKSSIFKFSEESDLEDAENFKVNPCLTNLSLLDSSPRF